MVTWNDGRQVYGVRAAAETMNTSVAAGVRRLLLTAVADHGMLAWEIDIPQSLGCPAFR